MHDFRGRVRVNITAKTQTYVSRFSTSINRERDECQSNGTDISQLPPLCDRDEGLTAPVTRSRDTGFECGNTDAYCASQTCGLFVSEIHAIDVASHLIPPAPSRRPPTNAIPETSWTCSFEVSQYCKLRFLPPPLGPRLAFVVFLARMIHVIARDQHNHVARSLQIVKSSMGADTSRAQDDLVLPLRMMASKVILEDSSLGGL